MLTWMQENAREPTTLRGVCLMTLAEPSWGVLESLAGLVSTCSSGCDHRAAAPLNQLGPLSMNWFHSLSLKSPSNLGGRGTWPLLSRRNFNLETAPGLGCPTVMHVRSIQNTSATFARFHVMRDGEPSSIASQPRIKRIHVCTKQRFSFFILLSIYTLVHKPKRFYLP
jgi:hypothetical protein